MSWFEKIIYALQFEHERPTNYGSFHIISVVLCIAVTVLMCIFLRKISDKKFRIIVGAIWGLMVLAQVYIELAFSFNNQTLVWDYDWYSFPFQLCTTPLYLLPFVIFMKDCKVRDAIIMFLTTFSFFGGLCVYVFPNSVFNTPYFLAQVRTMFHHGTQIIFGVYFAIYFRKKMNIKNFLYSLIVFGVLLVIAMAINLIGHAVSTETINMFYISPYFECELPVLNVIYNIVPYFVFLLIYIIGFAIAAFAIYWALIGGMKLGDIIKGKIKSKKD